MSRLSLLIVPLALAWCGAMAAQEKAKPRFVDVTAASGIVVAENTNVRGTNPHAVAVEDFNGDGLHDIIIPTFNSPHIRYFQNLGGLKFKDVTKDSGLESFEGDGTGIAVADYNRDGKLDVYMTSLRKGASRLYQGKGDGTFLDVSDRAGVLLNDPARSCSWSDIDGDGWIDLYVTSPKGRNFLFRNKGDGTFADIAQQAGVDFPGRQSLGCAFGDVDRDGLDDLVVTAYQSQVSGLFKNLGNGKFRDITAKAKLERKASSVGCVFADLKNHGHLDLFITTDSWLSGANYTEAQLLKMKHTVEPNILYQNDGLGVFTPVQAATLDHKTLSHDAVIEDFDHDGLLDIYVGIDATSGEKWATSKGGNPLWTRAGEGQAWQEQGQAWGVDYRGNCVCVPAADFDNDGDLDLLLVNFYSNVVLLRNETNDKNWLRVQAVGTKCSLEGIGAKVSVYDGPRTVNSAQLIASRAIQSGAGYCRCSPLEAHVGLGKDPKASYRVEVYFPATKTHVVREGVQPGQKIVMRESDK